MYDAVENNGKYTRWEALAQLVTMFTILGGVYYLSSVYDAPSRNPAVRWPYMQWLDHGHEVSMC